MTTMVWIPILNKHRFWWFYFSVFSLVFVSIEELYRTLNHVSLATQTPCTSYFQLFPVLRYPNETLPRVQYITSSSFKSCSIYSHLSVAQENINLAGEAFAWSSFPGWQDFHVKICLTLRTSSNQCSIGRSVWLRYSKKMLSNLYKILTVNFVKRYS